MSIGPYTNDRIDVTETEYVQNELSVSTSAIEAKVGSSRIIGRQSIILSNKGPNVVYFGGSGVSASTGAPLYKKQTIKLMVGDIGIFLICATGQSANVAVQELS